MPIEKTITLYTFDELESERAKENARDWWRSCRDASDLDTVREDFERVCDAFGIRLKTHTVRLMGGGTREEANIYWQVSYCQGDFAAFEGRWSYVKGMAAAVKAYAPSDERLAAIADDLTAIARRNKWDITCDINYHSYYGLEVDIDPYWNAHGETDSDLKEAFRNLAQWLYELLRTEDEYQTSDEYVDEALQINEYTFTEDGNRED